LSPSWPDRPAIDARLGQRPHVWATALGAKLTDGERRTESAYVIFVTRKIPRGKLRSHELLPRTVVRRGRRILTDVEELRPLRREGAGPPLAGAAAAPAAIAITDGVRSGTLSCLGLLDGRAVGVSCAHVLAGPDRSAVTRDPIRAYAPGAHSWRDVGTTLTAVYRNGQGIPADFGRLDVGTFSIEDAELAALGAHGAPLEVLVPPTLESLKGRPVRALGVMAGLCEGFVRAVAFVDQGSQTFVDVVVRGRDGRGITNPGDSGMIWRAPNGAGVALHMLGEDRGPAASPTSFCCLLSRAVAALDLGRLRAVP
jgi:hypothetical protein